MKNKINYKNSYFILSIQNIHNLPNDNISEIAFIGRSNSGKSSAINTLTNQKIAKTSKKPGCTKLINLFIISSKIRLIDFPGYGYANISKKIKKKWKIDLNQYLKTRKNLTGVILTTDIRNSINKTDQKIIIQTQNINIPILILLNKSDKISKYKSSIQSKQIKKYFLNNVQIIIFSTKQLIGIQELKKTINNWYNKQLNT